VNDTHRHWPVVEQGFREAELMNPESHLKFAIFTLADM
jgi:hypothetical protein